VKHGVLSRRSFFYHSPTPNALLYSHVCVGAIFQFQSVTQESAKLLCYLVFGLLCLTSYAPHTRSLLGRCPSSSDVSPWPWPWPWPLRPWPWQFLGLPWSWPYEALTVKCKLP